LFCVWNRLKAVPKFVSGTDYLSPSVNTRTGPTTIITEVRIAIDEVLVGDISEKEITFIMECGNIEGVRIFTTERIKLNCPEKGDIVVAGLLYNSFNKGRYVASYRNMIFKKESDGWIPYLSQSITNEDPVKITREAARKRDFKYLYNHSDVVCIGIVTEYHNLLDEDNRKLSVTVDETLKGSIDNPNITVNASRLYLPFFSLQDPGYRVLLFLKPARNEYLPIHGTLGYYKLEGDRILKNHGRPLSTTVTKLKNDIKNVYIERGEE
jgi:hypothetical protein